MRYFSHGKSVEDFVLCLWKSVDDHRRVRNSHRKSPRAATQIVIDLLDENFVHRGECRLETVKNGQAKVAVSVPGNSLRLSKNTQNTVQQRQQKSNVSPTAKERMSTLATGCVPACRASRLGVSKFEWRIAKEDHQETFELWFEVIDSLRFSLSPATQELGAERSAE
jgi:hypothetical protein